MIHINIHAYTYTGRHSGRDNDNGGQAPHGALPPAGLPAPSPAPASRHSRRAGVTLGLPAPSPAPASARPVRTSTHADSARADCTPRATPARLELRYSRHQLLLFAVGEPIKPLRVLAPAAPSRPSDSSAVISPTAAQPAGRTRDDVSTHEAFAVLL